LPRPLGGQKTLTKKDVATNSTQCADFFISNSDF